MINGDPNEFIEGLYYGDERFYVYKGVKYFLQGYTENDQHVLELYAIEVHSEDDEFHWSLCSGKHDPYPVKGFEEAKIFDGKSFWEVEDEIEWVDD